MSKRVLAAEDLYDLVAVGDPRVSPDGKHVVYVRQHLDREGDETRTDLWIANVSGGEPRRLTAGNKDREPRWAPGGRLAFLSERTGKKQIHVMDVRGGEAWALPTEQVVESAPIWSPDGTRIAFIARAFDRGDDWVPYPGCPDYDRERAGKTAASQLESKSQGSNERKKDPLGGLKVITESIYRFDGMGYFGDLNRHLFVVDVPQRPGPGDLAVRQLTHGPYNHGEPAWSPDGRFLAVTALRRQPSYDDLFKTDIWTVELASGELAQVLDSGGPVAGLTWSPDGKYLAYFGHHGESGRSTSAKLWLVPVSDRESWPLSSAELTCLTGGLDRPTGMSIPSDVRYAPAVSHPAWASDSSSICFLVGDRGTTWIYRAGLGDQEDPQPLVGGDERVVASVSVGPRGILGYQAGSGIETDEIFVQVPGEKERQITRANADLFDRTEVSCPRPVCFKGADDWPMDGWLYRPPAADENESLPLVLMIHGGPHGAYGHGFNFLTQYLAAEGFSVLMLNPRGSQTYGQKFASAVVEDWGGKDYQDLMAGVDHVVSLGLVDPDRLGVTGWSYGGFMTNWVIGHTERFKAAVTGACIFNHLNFYGTSDIGPTFGEFQWGGNPWDDPDRLLDLSPMKNAGRIETPTLILHGEADLRCPVDQGEQLFATLKRRGKEVVMVRYPGEFHGLKKPGHRVDRCKRSAAWFKHHVKQD